MAQPKMQEPTMEEILASIRRIIDSGEDQGRDSGERGFRPARYDAPPADAAPTDYVEDHWQEPPARDPVVVSRTHAGNAEDYEAAPEFEAPADDAAPEAAAEAHEPQSHEPQQEVYPGSLSEVAEQVRAAASTDVEDETLLSSDTEKRIGEALRELSVALEREGARSMEEIVAEELRPLLREWLDEHMPSIVETMVAKEIERMRTAKR